ncbi:uncharacterized protein LOC144750935 [Ciona intestinalis]
MSDEKWDMYELLNHFELVEWEFTNMANLVLETLDLDECELETVPPAITEIEYYAFRDVQAVSLNNNPNITNADILGKLLDMQAINMWGCRLTTIPKSWVNLHKLQVLGLGNTPTLKGYGPLRNLTNIQWLDLGGCGLKSIPQEVTHLTKLTVLALGKNEGIEIDDSLCCFWNLQRLALNECALKAVPTPIYSLIRLTHLHLDNNMLFSIGQQIVQLKALEELSVTGNDNMSFPKLLSQCENVKRIIVDENLNLSHISHSLRKKMQVACRELQPAV